MNRYLSILFFIATFAASTTAKAECHAGQGGQVAGTVIGAALGGLLGHALDGGRHRTGGTLIGVAAGAFVGNRLGKALDQCEQKQMSDATQTSLDGDGHKAGASTAQTWTSESRPGVSGSAVASPPVTTSDGRTCRRVTRVNYVNGQEMQDSPTFCKVPPATSWALAA